jgi:hypothetical protein
MDCKSEAASHYAGCDCNEEHWQDQVARLTRERDEARERAAGLSRELLDAMQARDRLAERTVTMQLMLDAIEGWATDQPGEMPTAVADGWSTALSAAVARIAAAEPRAERLEAALREIESKTGHFGEAPPPPEWMPMLALIAWVGRISRAALGEVGK